MRQIAAALSLTAFCTAPMAQALDLAAAKPPPPRATALSESEQNVDARIANNPEDPATFRVFFNQLKAVGNQTYASKTIPRLNSKPGIRPTTSCWATPSRDHLWQITTSFMYRLNKNNG